MAICKKEDLAPDPILTCKRKRYQGPAENYCRTGYENAFYGAESIVMKEVNTLKRSAHKKGDSDSHQNTTIVSETQVRKETSIEGTVPIIVHTKEASKDESLTASEESLVGNQLDSPLPTTEGHVEEDKPGMAEVNKPSNIHNEGTKAVFDGEDEQHTLSHDHNPFNEGNEETRTITVPKKVHPAVPPSTKIPVHGYQNPKAEKNTIDDRSNVAVQDSTDERLVTEVGTQVTSGFRTKREEESLPDQSQESLLSSVPTPSPIPSKIETPQHSSFTDFNGELSHDNNPFNEGNEETRTVLKKIHPAAPPSIKIPVHGYQNPKAAKNTIDDRSNIAAQHSTDEGLITGETHK